jgi:hypothetical protein
MAATILGMTYEDALARYKAGDPVADNARVCGKGVGFGAPGGLGKATFARYAWKSYKIRMSEDQAAVLINQYKSTRTEMPKYFRWVNSLVSVGTETYNVVQPWSRRLRAGASYCAACNSPFQGLGADVAKYALWLVWKACMGVSELGEADPLFGCVPVNFVHDSIMTEAPEDRAHAAAIRQQELMDLAGRTVLPDVPVTASALICRQWSKKAKAMFDADGRLVPWDLREACRRELEKHIDTSAPGWAVGPAQALEFLTSKEWPTDVARDTVAAAYGLGKGKAA